MSSAGYPHRWSGGAGLLPPKETVRNLSYALGVPACFVTKDFRVSAVHPDPPLDDAGNVALIEQAVRQRLSAAAPFHTTRVLDDGEYICVGPVWDRDTGGTAGYVVVRQPARHETATVLAWVDRACGAIGQWLQLQRELAHARKEAVREVALAVLSEGGGASGFWTDRLRSLGVPLAPFYRPAVLRQLTAISHPPEPGTVLATLREGLEREDPRLFVGTAPNACYTVFFPDEHLSGRETEAADRVLEDQLRRLGSVFHVDYVGILADHNVGVDVVADVSRDLLRILPVALRAEVGPGVKTRGHYALQSFLGSVDPRIVSEFVTATLGPLLDYDAAHGTRLLATLVAYLEEGCSVSLAGSRLFFHRNTVRRQLDRVEEILDVSLTNTRVCFMLLLAASLMRWGDTTGAGDILSAWHPSLGGTVGRSSFSPRLPTRAK